MKHCLSDWVRPVWGPARTSVHVVHVLSASPVPSTGRHQRFMYLSFSEQNEVHY